VQPETRYTAVGDSQIAYQVIGEGPRDLVLMMSFLNHIDVRWEEPSLSRFIRRLTSFSRVILFDRRGIGASDPLPGGRTASWEDWLDDIVAVMDAAGSKRATILAFGDATPLALLFAATHQERVESLALWGAFASALRTDEHPWGQSQEQADAFVELVRQHWAREDDVVLRVFAPSKVGDEPFSHWHAKLRRAGLTPRRAAEVLDLISRIDVTPALPLISVPTCVMTPDTFSIVPPQEGEFVASRIPGAKHVPMPGVDMLVYASGADRVLDLVEEFVTGERAGARADRVLATVLFTDIVGSTEQAVQKGDRRWREVLDTHDDVARQVVERHDGRLVKTTGDGVLATFDGPARAVRAAAAMRDALRRAGVEIRAGLHAGEVERRGDDVGGIAVHIAARVMAQAGPGEVLCSATVKGLVAGSGLEFEDRGEHTLKGVPDRWPLYALVAGA